MGWPENVSGWMDAILPQHILQCHFNSLHAIFNSTHVFPLALMGVLASGSAHVGPSAQPPIDTRVKKNEKCSDQFSRHFERF
jgi:hypothetical protein